MNNKQRFLIFFLLTLLLAGCSSPTQTITPLMTAPSVTAQPSFRSSSGDVTASGVVVPAVQSDLGLAFPARIDSVEVIENEVVEKGQVLVKLAGYEALEAAVAAAEYELFSAQLAADMALPQAQLEWANALDALDDAERQWTVNQPGNRATASALKDAKADVIIAEQILSQARINLKNASGAAAKAQAQNALTAAERAYYQAVWLVDWYQSEPTELEQALLDGNLAYARARLDSAERELALLQDDTDPNAIGLAEARLRVAETGLIAAQAALADSEIRAPIGGSVTRVNIDPGEVVVPGQVLLTIADLDHFQVQTTDLSERDIAQVQVGQAVLVFLEALGEDIEGQVVSISNQSNTLGGDVLYMVTIDLPNHPQGLRWGMSAEVEINTE